MDVQYRRHKLETFNIKQGCMLTTSVDLVLVRSMALVFFSPPCTGGLSYTHMATKFSQLEGSIKVSYSLVYMYFTSKSSAKSAFKGFQTYTFCIPAGMLSNQISHCRHAMCADVEPFKGKVALHSGHCSLF